MFTAATGGDRHVGITFVDIDEPRIEIAVRPLETPGTAARLNRQQDLDAVLDFGIADTAKNLGANRCWNHDA